MKLVSGQRVELARSVGERLRVTWEITSGSAEVRGAGLSVPGNIPRDPAAWGAARQAMLDRIDAGVAAREVTAAQAEVLRSGDVSELDEEQLELVRAFLGREPVPVMVTNGDGETTVEHRGMNTSAMRTVMCVEAVGGPEGCTLRVLSVDGG
jgi:hypothetical protein